MKGADLTDKRVAFLATDGVEQVELTNPWEELQVAGAKTELISLAPGEIRGYHHLDKGDCFPVDKAVEQATVSDYDALVLPGGVANPDAMRLNSDAVSLVREFFDAGKPVAAICHAPWMLIEAGVVRDRTLTSFPSLQTDILNAGGNWVDKEVHYENGLITSRRPADLDAFCATLVEVLATV